MRQVCFAHRIRHPVALWLWALGRKYLPINGILQRAALGPDDRAGAGADTGRIGTDGETEFSGRCDRKAPRWETSFMIPMTAAASGGSPQEDGVEVLLTKQQLAERLQTSLRLIDNWRRQKGLPCLKIGQKVWFRWSDVVHHLEKISSEAKDQRPRHGSAELIEPPSDSAFSV